jgi:glycosyltransferase involved in cell wall biosynthesis
MKLLWYSNHPSAPTGYGTQTALLLPRLVEAGHEVHLLNQFGGPGKGCGMAEWNGVTVWPQGSEQYSVDMIAPVAKRVDPDYIISLFDVWPLQKAGVATEAPIVSWTPVDHFPVPPAVLQWAKAHPTIAMSEYGQAALKDAGVEAVYIPHALDSDVFQPMGREARKVLNVPEDAFLVVMNFANQGVFPDRKARGENLQALSQLMNNHPDVYAYIHTDVASPSGVPLAKWFQVLGIPMDRLRFPNVEDYRLGTVTSAALARLYSAGDVFLGASAGEGFGIPVAESMMCGVPAIVTDFTAQPEIVGDTGWAVPFQFQANWHQGVLFATPLVAGISQALEEAYEVRGSEEAEARSVAARARAVERYDMSTVWDEKWTPLLEDMEANRTRLRAERAGLTSMQSPLVDVSGKPLNRAQRRAKNRSKRRG